MLGFSLTPTVQAAVLALQVKGVKRGEWVKEQEGGEEEEKWQGRVPLFLGLTVL